MASDILSLKVGFREHLKRIQFLYVNENCGGVVVADNKTIHFIQPLPPKREKRVGIYCRVSTNSAE